MNGSSGARWRACPSIAVVGAIFYVGPAEVLRLTASGRTFLFGGLAVLLSPITAVAVTAQSIMYARF
ncbi:hypothetical protein [Halosimplex amylolyticum]|uniref:hypothetical protein n=1 Tax=Halosimplex amylolyticum TaxID=3396616 RepID=UPI003F5751BE